jgi:hypothetical protein
MKIPDQLSCTAYFPSVLYKSHPFILRHLVIVTIGQLSHVLPFIENKTGWGSLSRFRVSLQHAKDVEKYALILFFTVFHKSTAL